MKNISTKPMIVGCTCGKAEITKEWDSDLGTWYYFYECKKCGYYWEGPIFIDSLGGDR